MSTPRYGHTATLVTRMVNNAQVTEVLVLGGTADGVHALASAEAFDVTTQSFVPRPALDGPRMFHTATLLTFDNAHNALTNAQIVVAGGFQDLSTTLGTAVFYDPVMGAWPTKLLANARGHHAASLTPNNTVLLVGGETANGQVVTTSEIIDPISIVGEATVAGLNPRTRCTATLDPDGRVFIVGGADPSGQPLADSALFDEGRHASPGAVPSINSIQDVFIINVGFGYQLTGQFVFGEETTGGGTISSAANHPLVYFERADNVGVTVQPGVSWADTSTLVKQSTPPPVPGWYWVRVVENGIPSVAVPYFVK